MSKLSLIFERSLRFLERYVFFNSRVAEKRLHTLLLRHERDVWFSAIQMFDISFFILGNKCYLFNLI